MSRHWNKTGWIGGWLALTAMVAALAASGCGPSAASTSTSTKSAAPAEFALSAETKKLEAPAQRRIAQILEERCGRPSAVKLLGDANPEPARLKRGAEIYAQYCERCHGSDGDGAGLAASQLNPKPRDFRKGVFKFTSTDFGAKPLREDIIATVARGSLGTSMPSFDILPKPDLEAVVDYVLALTRRGELEERLRLEYEEAGEFDDEIIKGAVDAVATRWREAPSKVVIPLSPMPEFTLELADQGRKAFIEHGCSKCHGEDGRGYVPGNAGLTDVWNQPTRAADITSGMLRGGQKPIDVYRKILGGINGTPMPSFRLQLQSQPDTLWKLTAYVMKLTNVRRLGDIPNANASPTPTPPAAPATASATTATATATGGPGHAN